MNFIISSKKGLYAPEIKVIIRHKQYELCILFSLANNQHVRKKMYFIDCLRVPSAT